MLPNTLTIASASSHIGADVRANGAHIRELMTKAKSLGARLIHFPEGALSGYVKTEIHKWDSVDWPTLQAELEDTAAHAAELGIWVVVGANSPRPPPHWPRNALYVISDKGATVGRYDKRLISHAEATSWYTPGTEPLVFEVDGFRFGCTLCIEIHFPELFMEYAKLGVDGVLYSAYADDPIFAIEAQAHAAMNNVWFSVATPAVSRLKLPCTLIGPDGRPFGQATPEADLVYGTLDRARYEIALTKARPWRAAARQGIKLTSRE
ncbi:carbon-nitrogen hydrolase family protein [Bradyrhizobium sp. UFLA05-109]